MSYLQAVVIALVQGVTELFPISSLGHSVLVPAWIGGSWHTLVTQSSQASSEKSFYLAYIVALHCATALALLWFFRADWVRIIRGFLRSATRSVRQRRITIEGRDERLAWMIVIATIPAGATSPPSPPPQSARPTVPRPKRGSRPPSIAGADSEARPAPPGRPI